MCLMKQVKTGQCRYDIFSKVLSNVNTSQIEALSAYDIFDFEIGYELFQAAVFCPPSTVFELYLFIERLLSNETSRTIIKTIVHLFQFQAIRDETSFALAKQFYHVLAPYLNLQYGNVLSATSSIEQMQHYIRNDWPFFANYTDLVEKCVQERNCDSTQDIFRNLGKP